MSTNSNKGLAIGGGAIGVGLLAVAAALFSRGGGDAPTPPAQSLVTPVPLVAAVPVPAAPVAASAPVAAPVVQAVAPVPAKPAPVRKVVRAEPKAVVAAHAPAAPVITQADLQREREQAAAQARAQAEEQARQAAIQQAQASFEAAKANCGQQHELGTGQRVAIDAAAAVGGGAVGSRIGGGRGKKVATVLGTLGGAAAADVLQTRNAQAGYDTCVANAQAVRDRAVAGQQAPQNNGFKLGY